jgi:hypothetical protein
MRNDDEKLALGKASLNGGAFHAKAQSREAAA